MGQKIVFTMLAAVMTSAASALAYRATVAMWKAATGDHPPESLAARLLIRGPLRRRMIRLLAGSATA